MNMKSSARPQYSLLMLLVAVSLAAAACSYVRWFGGLGFIAIAFMVEVWSVSTLLARLGFDHETTMGVTWLVFLLTFYPLLVVVNWFVMF